MLNLITRIELTAAAADRFAAALPRLLAAFRAEPGCRSYTASRSVEEPRVFWMVEEFDSWEALEAHEATPHVKQLREEFGGSFAVPPVMIPVDPIG